MPSPSFDRSRSRVVLVQGALGGPEGDRGAPDELARAGWSPQVAASLAEAVAEPEGDVAAVLVAGLGASGGVTAPGTLALAGRSFVATVEPGDADAIRGAYTAGALLVLERPV